MWIRCIAGGILNKHSDKSESSRQIDVCELNASLESKSSDLKLLRAHGKGHRLLYRNN